MKPIWIRFKQSICRHQPRRAGEFSVAGQCVKCGKIMFMPVVQ